MNDLIMPVNNGLVPVLLVKRKKDDTVSVPLKISKIKMDVKVVGNIATTTIDLTFYNDLDRILDGEFCFPLGEDQTVSYFAMQTDKGLQEASVVEKAKGRVVYESIVRKQVDPALLEWTAGNNFRSRIYPIPAKGYKRIVIGFEQKLLSANTNYLYYQPFNFKDKVDEFAIRAEVFKQKVKPELPGDSTFALQFDKWEENWVAEKKVENYIADKPLSFIVPGFENNTKVYLENDANGSTAFYLTINPKVVSEPKKLPGKVTLLWDISGSSEGFNRSEVLKCLSSYFEKSSYPIIDLVCFSNEIIETKSFSNGVEQWNKIVETLESVQADGGTQLGCLDLTQYKTDEFILVSDGLSNFGNHEIKTSSVPVYTISCSSKANYSYLKYIAVTTGGSFINLSTTKQADAVAILSSNHFQFISAQYNTEVFTDVYPSKPMIVSNDFSLAGHFKGSGETITLNFGIGNKILSSEKITIENKPEKYNGMIPKMWAQSKLSELDVFYEENKKEITELAKAYGIVTRNTSLLILDNIEDYIAYKVEPKDADLKKQYLNRLNDKKDISAREKKDHLATVLESFEQWKKWYKTDFVYKKPEKEKRKERIAEGEVDHLRYEVNSMIMSADSSAAAPAARELNSNHFSYSAAAPSAAADGAAAGGVDKKVGNDVSGSLSSEIEMNAWSPNAAYIKILESTPEKDQYTKYLELKQKYHTTPSFFIDVSDFFVKQGDLKIALRILSNVAELQLENHQLLRVLAKRLQQLNQNGLAINVFQDVLKIREEEPQSYRDLGLAYEQNKEYQKAFDILAEVVTRSWDSRFPEIETLVLVEINHVISRSGDKLTIGDFDKRFIYPMPCDVRVVINWDTDNCDMDLWVTDPKEEKCFYSYPVTLSGGKITRDFTSGYGPEAFLIKKGTEGKYKVEVNYYGSRNQSLTGPTTVQAEIYTNYGRVGEEKRVVTLRLEDAKEVIHLADVLFKKN